MQVGLRKNWKWDSHLYSTLSSSGVDLDPGSHQALCYVIRFLGNMHCLALGGNATQMCYWMLRALVLSP
jgi:hypothetical protein